MIFVAHTFDEITFQFNRAAVFVAQKLRASKKSGDNAGFSIVEDQDVVAIYAAEFLLVYPTKLAWIHSISLTWARPKSLAKKLNSKTYGLNHVGTKTCPKVFEG